MEALIERFTLNFINKGRYLLFLEGFKNTIIIALCATLLGVAIGVIIAMCKVQHTQTGKLKVLNGIFSVYVAIVRGTPVTVQVMIMYFIVLKSMDSAILVAIIAFGINSGAYVSEIVRAGINAIDPGQMEAGRSLGLSRITTMRTIILPQAVKNILPALGNEFISLLKETSVVGFIPVIDLTKAGDTVRSATYDAYFTLIPVAIIYFILVMGLSALMKKFERRLARSDRG